jgi:ABC-2 type transport system permease protein
MRWWPSVFAMEMRKILAYRADFWITFIGQTFIQVMIARALWQSIFEAQGTGVMEGYTLETMTLYYLMVPTGIRMLTGENIGFISREIYDGTFNRYLIYPLSPFQYKGLTYLTHSFFYGLQLMLLYVLYHLLYTGSLGHPGNLLMGVTLFMVAAMAYMMMAIILELVSLWADNIWSLIVMLRFFTSFLGGGFIPLTFFPDWAQAILHYTPFPYLISIPVRTIMGLTTFSEVAIATAILLIWALIFMMGVNLVWRKGQKSYSGVGI